MLKYLFQLGQIPLGKGLVGYFTLRTYCDGTKNEQEKSIEKNLCRKEKCSANDLTPNSQYNLEIIPAF